MQSKCCTESSHYKCVAKSNNIPPKIYFGTSEGNWRTLYYYHAKAFRNLKYYKETTSSWFLWDSKNKNIPVLELLWSIEKKVLAYSNISKSCLLCLYDKIAIITFRNQDKLLKETSELTNKCRHENKFLLSNYKSNDWFYLLRKDNII